MSFFLVAAVLIVAPATASAQNPGFRGGVSVDPDQVYLGGHYETAPLVERLHFRPNVEFGFGDDLTHVGLNFEFVYKLPASAAWTLYAGGGPAVNFYSFNDQSDSEPGLNVLVGVEANNGLFFEFKLGALDSPDVKFGVGWSFR